VLGRRTVKPLEVLLENGHKVSVDIEDPDLDLLPYRIRPKFPLLHLALVAMVPNLLPKSHKLSLLQSKTRPPFRQKSQVLLLRKPRKRVPPRKLLLLRLLLFKRVKPARFKRAVTPVEVVGAIRTTTGTMLVNRIQAKLRPLSPINPLLVVLEVTPGGTEEVVLQLDLKRIS
jgi:hypothetical protein